jgi:hypothetical protein
MKLGAGVPLRYDGAKKPPAGSLTKEIYYSLSVKKDSDRQTGFSPVTHTFEKSATELSGFLTQHVAK